MNDIWLVVLNIMKCTDTILENLSECFILSLVKLRNLLKGGL